MKFDLGKALEILTRTPEVLGVQLAGLSVEWLHADEGPGTWSPFQVVGHLIINEKTNFLPRARLILSTKETKLLEPIDMTAHFDTIKGKDIDAVLTEFALLRSRNIEELKAFNISDDDLLRTAMHPKVGSVSLANVLSTWVAHDLTHIGQITRVIAKQYKDEVGPFIQFLTRLK